MILAFGTSSREAYREYMTRKSSCLEWFSRYSELWEVGEYYSALTNLGRIYEALEELPSSQKATLVEMVQQSTPSNKILFQIREKARLDLNRIEWILSSGGDRYDPDEVLLVLTIRDGLRVLAQFLHQAYNIELMLSLDGVDQLIKQKFSHIKLTERTRTLLCKVLG